MLKIAVLDDYQNVARKFANWEQLPNGTELRFFNTYIEEDARLPTLAPFDVVIVMRERTKFPAKLIEALPNLKLIVTSGMRNAAIDIAACKRRGIVVCGTKSAKGFPTAELTWSLLLALLKKVPQQFQSARAGQWQTDVTESAYGKRLGVIGLGRVGTQVARVGAAFGMEVVAWSPNLTQERAAAGSARYVTKEELLQTADIVTLHLILSKSTAGIVGKNDLALMKPSAYLINTARSGLVDEAALVEALRENTIAGAGLDVFAVEPLPEGHPLTQLSNVVLTPHLGYVTDDNYRVYYSDALSSVLGWIRGEGMRRIDLE
jgi:phosphoglycerate dehydrogenase-like enzyme